MASSSSSPRDSSPITNSSQVTICDDKKQSELPRGRCGLLLATIKGITVEPALFLYMISSFLFFPVFQALIYEKSCLNIYNHDMDLCTNDTATHRDKKIQSHANLVFMLSSVCLTIPSFISTIFLGSYSDRRSRKVALLLPYVGLVLSDVSYIVQATYTDTNVFLLLISDCLFGSFGGYSSIIGTSFSYGAQMTTTTSRSYRMALLEGCIGLGGTIGYLLSGILLKAVGYRGIFMISLVLHVISFIYLCLRTTDSTEQMEKRRRRQGQKCMPEEMDGEGTIGSVQSVATDGSLDEDGRCCWWLWAYLRDAISVLKQRSGHRRVIIVAILSAFSVSYLVFSGSQDIMLYYLKHELNWSSATYGIFRAVYFGSSSAAILLIFPLLKYWGLNDWTLAAIGLVSRMIGSLMLCFPFSTWFVFCVSIFYMFNRFAATGMRAIASKQVEKGEQGKLFAAIALIEAVCTLLASIIFNNLYSWSLSFYSGFCYVLMTVLMIIPLILIFFVGFRQRRSSNEDLQSSPREEMDKEMRESSAES